MLKCLLTDLPKNDMIDLVDSYDTYITNWVDDNANYKVKTDVIPFTMLEYYQEWLNTEV